jgi:hypothetical protein
MPVASAGSRRGTKPTDFVVWWKERMRDLVPASLRPHRAGDGAIDKTGAAAHEQLFRPSAYRWPDWIERFRTQARVRSNPFEAESWPMTARPDQVQITTAWMAVTCGWPIPISSRPIVGRRSARCEAQHEFKATYPAEYAVPRNAGTITRTTLAAGACHADRSGSAQSAHQRRGRAGCIGTCAQ